MAVVRQERASLTEPVGPRADQSQPGPDNRVAVLGIRQKLARQAVVVGCTAAAVVGRPAVVASVEVACEFLQKVAIRPDLVAVGQAAA